ncbi:TetR/AcrR family transcriptional regulator [Hominifimenecus sp. rT4P-3]|uniref:TetR/AcrR family transcriptional regulator n=1 Tax=Hominifimenecus sp. rT4P-3 TaxID=3242979 RepID=UPI003DA42D20
MPPKFKFTRDEVIEAALDLTREHGISAVTARGLGAKLGASAKPIFGLFQNMEEVQQEVLKAANRLYHSYLEEDMASGKYPPYKASGMAYIRFAREEKELFRLLFMRDRSHETIEKNMEEVRPLIELIQKNTGLNEEDAFLFHLEMWIYVHGIATMIATSYLEWDMEFISKVLTDGYLGLKHRCQEEEK